MFPIHNGERFPIIKSEMRMVEICSNRGLYELNAAIPAPRKSAIREISDLEEMASHRGESRLR